ncbi:MAG: hypothetical protein ACKVT0_12730 [Planctomycetaceae bacterium]
MTDANVPSQLIRLQNALLEGKIDRATYEQLKTDLLKSIGTEIPDDQPTVSEIEPPPENPFRKKSGVQPTIKTIKFRDLSQPPPPAATGETSKQTGSRVDPSKPIITPLPPKESRGLSSPDPLPHNKPAMSTAASHPPDKGTRTESTPPVSATLRLNIDGEEITDQEFDHQESTLETLRHTLRDPETWTAVGEIAAHCAIVMGLRSWSIEQSSILQALFWGVVSAFLGGLGALIWLLVNTVCRKVRDGEHDVLKLGFAQFSWTVLLLVAACFWVYIGTLYGGLVGTIVGGRYGFFSQAGGELVGGMIGLVKALQNYRNSRTQALERAGRSTVADDD